MAVYVADAGSAAAVFRARVMIDGVDQSNDVVGPIVIEQEEGAATIADITLMPVAGTPIYLPSWTGKSVVISIGDFSTGGMLDETVRFTGIVDLPSVDLDQKTLKLRCTDDLQGVIGAISKNDIWLLTDGDYSPVIFEAGVSSWAYCQDIMSTRQASIDISPAGDLRIAEWAAKPIPDLVFDADDIGDGSLAVDMAERSVLVNQINISFGYRFPRMKSEGWQCNYDALGGLGFSNYISTNKYVPTRDQVREAIEAAGGTIESITFDALPTVPVILYGPGGAVAGTWIPNPATDPTLCTGWQAIVSFDYAQETDEHHEIVVSTPLSIAEIGIVSETMSGALQAEYADVTSVETTATLYKSSITTIPPMDTATVVSGKTNAQDVTLTADSDRTAAEKAMNTLISIAKVRIAASHRRNVVSATVSLNGNLDVSKTVEISTAAVSAKGKVRKVVDVIDTDNAVATSAFELAISAIAGVGVTHNEDATDAPAGTVAAVSSTLAAPVVVFNNLAAGDHTITITFPGVEDAERDRASVTLPSAFDAAIPEDVFTVTL